LTDLKTLLRKKHNLSTFSTPIDLANKLSSDLGKLLSELHSIDNAIITNDIAESSLCDIDLIKRFLLQPKKYANKETVLTLEPTLDDMRKVNPSYAEALGVECGNAIYCSAGILKDEDSEEYIYESSKYKSTIDIYAEDDVATQLININIQQQQNASESRYRMTAKVRLIYGLYVETTETLSYDTIKNKHILHGLLVLDINKSK